MAEAANSLDLQFDQLTLDGDNDNGDNDDNDDKDDKDNDDNDDDDPPEDYYVHIDVLCGSTSHVSGKLNSFMVGQDAFDPRRRTNFPTDLMDEKDRIKERNGPNLKLRRSIAGFGNCYYEMWKVRWNFDISAFTQMVKDLPGLVEVRMLKIIDNEHELLWFASRQAAITREHYNSMVTKSLQKLCSSRNIKYSDKMEKTKLIEILMKNDQDEKHTVPK